MTLSQVLHELQTLRQVLPADAPVCAWMLSPGTSAMDVLEICGVTGGVDRASGRLCATLQLRVPKTDVAAPVEKWAAEKLAHKEGKRIEYNLAGSPFWHCATTPTWTEEDGFSYRVAPNQGGAL